MDQWIQVFSLAALLCLGVVTLYQSHQGVRCWCPAQFTESHVHYANAFCSDLHTPRYKPISEKQDKGPSGTTVFSMETLPYNLSKDKTLLKLIGCETLLAFALYSIIQVLKACVQVDVSVPTGLHKSHSKAPMYVLIQVTGAILWAFFAALTILAYEEKNVTEALSPFICQFKMQFQLRLHSYLVQCKDTGGGGLLMAVNANIGLAFVVAIAKFIHIIMCFMVQPRIKRDKLCIKLKEQKVIKDSREMGSCFALSDLYFAMLVTGADLWWERQLNNGSSNNDCKKPK